MKQKIKKEPATKEDLNYALEKQKEYYEEIVHALKDEMINKFIEVLGELHAMREENAVGAYQIRDVREELKSHDKRITKLENTQNN